MAKYDPELLAHKTWLGLLQPVGLVVSPLALIRAQAVLDKNIIEVQRRLLALVRMPPKTDDEPDPTPYLDDFLGFANDVLDWKPEDLAGAPGGPALDEKLELALPDYGETLRPTYAVVDEMANGNVLMLVQVLPTGAPLDETDTTSTWHALPQAKFERLLRELEIPAGLLCNGHELRLVYAPRGESSGHLTFPVAPMCEVGGRAILGAVHMLLSEHRVFSAPDGCRLLDLLEQSRKYQAEVSNKLSEQVLGALWELLSGFQAAAATGNDANFQHTARQHPDQIYGGLLAVLLRLVFLLYAEDEGLMPDNEVYARNYSVSGLYARLRADAGSYPDTMDQRYGAWSCLLSLFRLVYDGGGHTSEDNPGFHLPTRHGQLFNPDEFAFLEGRPNGVNRVIGERFDAPKVSDGCIYRVLTALLILDVDGDGIGDRLSYRALDVEQIGSVYESIMGFEVERTAGRSIAVRPKDVVIDVDELLKLGGGKRAKRLKELAECELSDAAAVALKNAERPDDVLAALGRKISPRTPRLLPPGGLCLQPGEERRRSGSHYTPRNLTEPIVRTTLRPVLEALGAKPSPAQILDLKVCDPAMGSGAFLVESCRQLAEHLVEAWQAHDSTPELPPDEEALLHARRLVAQRCLYGVDKNPFAVNLAKLSLWLVTLAKDHAFTFLDHALKHGDSLVGLKRDQIAAFHWKSESGNQIDWLDEQLKSDLAKALGWRGNLQELDEGDYNRKKQAWWEAENALADARLIADLAVAAFFGADKDRAREELRDRYRGKVQSWRANDANRHDLERIVEDLRGGEKPVPPLHWEIEFPEVFDRANPGFDAIVGNPPFMRGHDISKKIGNAYRDAISLIAGPRTPGIADYVAYFFPRAAAQVRAGGAIGFLATNSISAGDSQKLAFGSLPETWSVYSARTDIDWPGSAGIVVSEIHLLNGSYRGGFTLNGRTVPLLTRALRTTASVSPRCLVANDGVCFVGSYPLGDGYIIPAATAQQWQRSDARYGQVVFPYLNGIETNSIVDFDSDVSRWAISFWDWDEEQAMEFSEAYEHLKRTVLSLRARQKEKHRRERWWQHARPTPGLYYAIGRGGLFVRSKVSGEKLGQVLVKSKSSNTWEFTFLPNDMLYDQSLAVFAIADSGRFAVLQSSIHELWAWDRGSKLKIDLSYTPSTVFQTFPMPKNPENLVSIGDDYFRSRGSLQSERGLSLTEFANAMTKPDERSSWIQQTRALKDALDVAVLRQYGWDDLAGRLHVDWHQDPTGAPPKSYLYRWSTHDRQEVLARLLDLNQKRYQEEVTAGLHEKKKPKKKAAARPRKKKAKIKRAVSTLSMFDTANDDDVPKAKKRP